MYEKLVKYCLFDKCGKWEKLVVELLQGERKLIDLSPYLQFNLYLMDFI